MEYPSPPTTVVGAGLAGVEAAFWLLRHGHALTLLEQKPHHRSPAHQSDLPAELVCSNSLRSDEPTTGIGLLHEELRLLGSLTLRAADANRVPAGSALAVDRQAFSQSIADSLQGLPGLFWRREEATSVPEGLCIVATGPLTSEAFSQALAPLLGDRLYFYDAIAPVVAADSIDMGVAFRQGRFQKGDDYLNLPLDKESYLHFIHALRTAQKVPPHAFEELRYFEACLPIEAMAERGEETLAFGPLKPVGLRCPRTGKRPHAVVQLRQEDKAQTAYNLVGFQTRLTYAEQKRIFGSLPGLQNAQWLRLGQIHRNTFMDAPRLLGEDLSLLGKPGLFFAGQITGVEGYTESAASGLLTAMAVQARLEGRVFVPPPPETALGALYGHLRGQAGLPGKSFQPSHINFGLFPPLAARLRKCDKKAAIVARARVGFREWMGRVSPACRENSI
ncbi:MAG: methylenetetrahydrofolate--tRNA-(uracil(54)-C(5))-methyltransferase (FADH(2)-oxidizing) TrmFO [Proteobacteria bacterium]|nr:methylenetetrahydrofolate--tRNA-(uracil(54)-C(5))-methyltransferase (FADH(2)-oxidizing) TrmFO [Cystobacterineae bacterium]MCL2258810.1 methylenetetrahydrofolate--tRNA-(uracil(54)-C(5))-methyltransferase (FADH(2)-oxidizing) TrmFO [Cystobacterineae bacterium]MCL2314818.1 methylenetetrahydrofolate--tRNA-(uracil(54)-C(5))-methyltransferase (FADH(2)-oxidizing) TrmFO [Pseudomonadota bacterium]